MSRDIHMRAEMRGIEIEFIMPNIGEFIDLDFNGHYLVEALNDNGEMRVTGLGMNGYGDRIDIEERDVKFKSDGLKQEISDGDVDVQSNK